MQDQFSKYNILNWLVLAILLTLIVSLKINSLFLGVFLISCFILWRRQVELPKDNTLYLVSNLALFLVFGWNVFTSDNSDGALFFLERNLVFLLIPIALLKVDGRYFNRARILKSYIYILTLLLALAFMIALYKNAVFNVESGFPLFRFKSWFFTYHYLAGNLNCTAIYLSLYIGFGSLVLLLDILGLSTLGMNLKKWQKVLMICFLYFGLLMLSARTILISTIFCSVLLIGKHAYSNKYFFKYLIVLAILFASAAGFVYKNDVLRLRFVSIFQDQQEAKYFSGGLDSRVKQWKAIVEESLDKHPVFGVGTGDTNKEYLRIYSEYDLKWAYDGAFNAHNMFVEVFYATGFVGLLLISAIFFISFRKAFISKDLVHLVFLVLIIMSGLTESILNRQFGIVFFVLLNTLFFYINSTQQINEASDIRHQGHS